MENNSTLKINEPKVELHYYANYGWYIVIDGTPVEEKPTSIKTRYFYAKSEAINYVYDRGLVVN